MLAPASSTASAFSDEYRRRARKLRAQHAHDLASLHKALIHLAQEADQQEPPAPKPQGPAAEFAQLVAQELEGPILRYSKRQALLRDAERRGIGRFEANLIIAAVQHQVTRSAEPAAQSPDNSSHWRTAIAACAVQGLIFLAMYLLLFA
jgi:hypothetical protein